MWNGFLRITAMVGVIGVGLFAVYHAQKQMNFKVPFAFDGSGEPRALPDNSDTAAADSQADEPLLEDAAEIGTVAQEQKPQIGNARRQQTEMDELASLSKDTLDAVSSEEIVAGKRPPQRTTSTKRTPVAKVADSFDDDLLEPVGDLKKTTKTASADTRSPREDARTVNATQETHRRKGISISLDESIRNISATATDEAFSTDEEASALEDETATVTTQADLSTNSEPSEAVETTEIVSKPTETSDFAADPSPPPRSKRAMQKSDKKSAPRQSTDIPSFTIDAPPKTSQPVEQSESTLSIGDIQLGPSEKLNSDPVTEPAATEAPLAAPAIATPPRSLPIPANDATKQSEPETTSAPPAALPFDLDNPTELDRRNRTARQARESSTRRRDSEIRPVDMVGDGLAGDASQRGVQQPRLSFEKKAQQQAVLGQPLVYDIIVKNNGVVDAHNVVIEEPIPKGAELIGTAPQAEMSGRRLIWNQPVLKPNESKKISVKIKPTQEGSIGSSTRIYFSTEVTAEIVVSAPQLEFKVKAPGEVRLGQKFDLVYVLKNVGKVDATNITVRDIVPDELKNETGNDIECPLGTLAPGEVREIVLPVTATKTGSVINQAILTADTGIKKSLESAIDIVGEVLVLTRLGQNRLYVERPAVFTNNIRNDGNQRAEKIRISEAVPAGMQFASASDGGRFDSKLGAVVWAIGPLEPGTDKTISVKYVPKETGTFDAKITATGSAGSTAAINAAVDVVGKPELQMETLSATGAVTIGDRITSKFQLNNTGTAAATNVQLVIHLPRELRLISATGARTKQIGEDVIFEPIPQFDPRSKPVSYELVIEPIAEADAQISLEISADHLAKPHRRVESIQIASDPLR